MRLFTGIAFDADTRTSIERALEKARPAAADARWVKPKKVHLTLVFIDHADPSVMIARTAEVVARHAAMTLHLEGAGAFGRRVLWLGVGGDIEPLAALQAELAQGYERPNEHPYSPHVTLARAKRPRSFRPAVEALEGFRSAPFRVGTVTLFDSKDGTYLPLIEAPLRT
jgi:2'-5' RNA ligase